MSSAPKVPRFLIEAVLAALHDILADGRMPDRVLEHAFKQHPKWGARDRRIVAEGVYELVRWWRWFWHLAGFIDSACLRPGSLTEQALWRVWAVYWLEQGHELPDYARSAFVEPAELKRRKHTSVPRGVRASIPDWLDEAGSAELGSDWPSMLEALNRPADVFLRTNTLKIQPEALIQRLASEGVEAATVPGAPDALRLAQRRNVFTTTAFREGLFEVQDAASQKIAPFLQVEPGMRVIDGCAGAGGKTLHLACLMRNKGRILALDLHERKLQELRRRASRNGIDIIEVRVIESAKTLKRLGASADRVLLDVPCSGLGVLRRNPDAKWKLNPGELDRVRDTQAKILADGARMVKPGGKLVYATCSILPSENERQITHFLEAHPGTWQLEDEIHLLPQRDGFDGFYAARLTRNALAGNIGPETVTGVADPDAPASPSPATEL